MSVVIDVGRGLLLSAFCVVLAVVPTAAQVATPAVKASTDAPSIRVGAVIFADYTIQSGPKGRDADGNDFTPNAFNVPRAYINVTGTLSRHLAFRITPDVVRETGSASSASGSQVFRLKYAYAQLNLDTWMKGLSWVRLGVQQTPWVDFMETVYRYRFQGTILEDREGYLSSADAGVSTRYTSGGGAVDVHAGFYNGENFTKSEANDQKAFMVRATVRPLGAHPVLGGLRITGFYDKDAYLKQAERRRAIAAVTFERPTVHAAANYFTATDQVRAGAVELDARGFSLWVTPRSKRGWEALLRHDRLRQDQVTAADEGRRARTIAGIARWFPRQGSVTTAVLLDVENVRNTGYVPARPHERRWALHTLISF